MGLFKQIFSQPHTDIFELNTNSDEYKKEVQRSYKKTPLSMQTTYFNQIKELIDHCYNKTTGEFDWKYYFDECDALFYCPHLWVKDQLIQELRYIGEDQVRKIRVILMSYRNDPAMLKEKIKGIENSLIRNLTAIFDGGRDGNFPPKVDQLRNALYEIYYNKIDVTEEYVNSLIDLTNKIA